ncbi:dCMP deaminase family protein [Candidatus Micrarchaeota archaeon]|nr:dCMP deaminase family protein [Candidatus Micrarchaeota archaeon]MBI5176695.1 dCMP deaminase family protein [Candidatus Micrarchaeota archaeon]
MQPEENRPSRDEWFAEMALVISKRSTCKRTSQGALLVDRRGFVISLGYNGSPMGMRHCEWDPVAKRSRIFCEKHHQCMCIHAEMNAIINAARHASLREDTILYATGSPCCECMKAVIQAGVKRIVFVEEYEDGFAKELAKEANIEMVHLPHPKVGEGRRTYS